MCFACWDEAGPRGTLLASWGMSDATVKTHIAHIYRKLGINSQQSLLDIVEEHVGRS